MYVIYAKLNVLPNIYNSLLIKKNYHREYLYGNYFYNYMNPLVTNYISFMLAVSQCSAVWGDKINHLLY